MTKPNYYTGKVDPQLAHYHPSRWIQDTIETIKRVGVHDFVHSPKCQKDREKLSASVFAFGVRQIDQREWWLQQPKIDPPDFEMIAASDRSIKDQPIDHHQIEIVEIPLIFDQDSDRKEKALAVVQKKLSRVYSYKDCALLIFINSSDARTIFSEIEAEVRNQTFPAGIQNIWAMYIIDQSPATAFVYELREITPNNHVCQIAIKPEMAKGILYPHPIHQKLRLK